MDDNEHLTVDLPPSTAGKVREAVESGEYASAQEVIHAALRLWEERRGLRPRSIEDLRRLYNEGKASGIAGPLDMPKILKAAKDRARAARNG